MTEEQDLTIGSFVDLEFVSSDRLGFKDLWNWEIRWECLDERRDCEIVWSMFVEPRAS
jgi:hypothetical protein